MNVMAQAHKDCKARIAAGNPNRYADLFRVALRKAHKEFKAMQQAKKDSKFIVDHYQGKGKYLKVDIRTLPTFEASQGINQTVNGWTIKGSVKGEQRYTEQVSGFSEKTLAHHLTFWADASNRGYTDLCLMLVIDDKLYRLVK